MSREGAGTPFANPMTTMPTEQPQSTRSAAMLLLALGESEAATVLKHLDAKVVQRLGTAIRIPNPATNFRHRPLGGRSFAASGRFE